MKKLIVLVLAFGTFNAIASNGSFVCAPEGVLFSSNLSTALTAYESEDDCLLAVLRSRNGFICAPGGVLYNCNFNTPLATYESEEDCFVAVGKSE